MRTPRGALPAVAAVVLQGPAPSGHPSAGSTAEITASAAAATEVGAGGAAAVSGAGAATSAWLASSLNGPREPPLDVRSLEEVVQNLEAELADMSRSEAAQQRRLTEAHYCLAEHNTREQTGSGGGCWGTMPCLLPSSARVCSARDATPIRLRAAPPSAPPRAWHELAGSTLPMASNGVVRQQSAGEAVRDATLPAPLISRAVVVRDVSGSNLSLIAGAGGGRGTGGGGGSAPAAASAVAAAAGTTPAARSRERSREGSPGIVRGLLSSRDVSPMPSSATPRKAVSLAVWAQAAENAATLPGLSHSLPPAAQGTAMLVEAPSALSLAPVLGVADMVREVRAGGKVAAVAAEASVTSAASRASPRLVSPTLISAGALAAAGGYAGISATNLSMPEGTLDTSFVEDTLSPLTQGLDDTSSTLISPPAGPALAAACADARAHMLGEGLPEGLLQPVAATLERLHRHFEAKKQAAGTKAWQAVGSPWFGSGEMAPECPGTTRSPGYSGFNARGRLRGHAAAGSPFGQSHDGEPGDADDESSDGESDVDLQLAEALSRLGGQLGALEELVTLAERRAGGGSPPGG